MFHYLAFASSTWNILEPLDFLGAVDVWGIAGWAHAKGGLVDSMGQPTLRISPWCQALGNSPKHVIYCSSQQLSTITYLIGGLEHDFYGVMMVNDDFCKEG